MNCNDLISTISYVIGSQYPNMHIYKENVKQGFETPSFFIQEINHTHQKQLGRRYKRRYSIAIKYYTDSTEEINQDLHNVASNLEEILECMQYNELIIKGTNMESKIDEDILHFQLDVKVNLIKEINNSKFGELEVESNVKQ